MYPVCVCVCVGWGGVRVAWLGGVVQTPAETWCDHEILKEITSPRCRTFDLLKIRSFVRPAEQRWRIFLPQTRSRSLHAVALPENVTFPLHAHHPPLKRARMTSSRHGNTRPGGSRRSSGRQTDPERWQSSFVVGFFFVSLPTALLTAFALETHAA